MSQPRLSLLSLSIAAASAAPASPIADPAARSPPATNRPPDVHPAQIAGATTNTTKHRRLSSAGRSRRRLSDARDAATRPFPTSLQTASASLAALSLSSPTLSHRTQPIQVSQATPAKGASELEPGSVDETRLSASPSQTHPSLAAHTTNGTRSARKRGSIFTCESCFKVYRHPSCLIKHRWEHTPQWQEASKFVLSKHQQVQLLEAAAILSHLSPSSASLPEDRSLWPSFLSGGLVPPPASMQNHDLGSTPVPTMTALSPPTTYGVHAPHPISSSVPAGTTMGSHDGPSAGPRLHDYAIDRSGVTHARPRVLGMQTEMDREGVPMPGQTTEDDALNLLALRSGSGTGSWGGPTSVPPSRSRAGAHAHSLSLSSLAPPRERERRRSNAYEYGFAHDAWRPERAAYTAHSNGGWSLPRSSVRSKSGSSRSRSASESRSDDEREDEGEGVFGAGVAMRVGLEDETEDRVKVYGSRMRAWKTDDGDDGGDGELMGVVLREDEREYLAEDKAVRRVEQMWDGMEMEMEMD